MEDRRSHPRIVADIDLRTEAEGGTVARMVSRNLSMGGLSCTSTTDFPEMTRLAVQLMLPQNGSVQPVDVEAVVVRSQPRSNGYELALFFTGVDPEVRDRLARYLGEN